MTALLDWGVAARPKPGFDVSGDLHRVRDFEDGVLVVVIDGIGHGVAAHEASAAVARVVDEPGLASLHKPPALADLVGRCHEAARRTRGCVMSAAFVDDESVEWVGVGNVDGAVRFPGGKRKESLVHVGGIVGERLPKVIARRVPFGTGDVLVLATDGAPAAVLDDVLVAGPAQAVADDLLRRHALASDDALVLVARRLGAADG